MPLGIGLLTMSSLAHDNDAFDDERELERFRPLEDRLRRLNWPQPPPGVRERTLEELHRMLDEHARSGR